jgi:four helix bundle protein
MIRDHHDLEIWRRSMDLVQEVYRVTRGFPREEVYGLAAQLRRAAVSVPSNIAEGHGRTGKQEFLHHLSIARGSLLEAETQIEVAARLGYVTADAVADVLQRMHAVSNGIRSLLRRWGAGR